MCVCGRVIGGGGSGAARGGGECNSAKDNDGAAFDRGVERNPKLPLCGGVGLLVHAVYLDSCRRLR